MAISTLLTAFLKSLYRYISSRHYILADVVAGEFLYLNFERPPCFSLSNPANRWFAAVPSEKLENLVWKFFERRLDVETEPIVCQMELLTVVFATHNFKIREADEEDTWMAWLELLEASILGLELERPDDQEIIKDTTVDTTSSTPRKRANSPPLLPGPETPHSIPISSTRRGSSMPQLQPDSGPAPRQPPGSARETDGNAPEVQGRFGTGHVDQPLVLPSVQAATTGPVTSAASAGENTVKPRSPPPPPAPSTSAKSPENGSTDLVLSRTSAAPSRWRPGDKARVIISKKLRDVEIIREDGELRMRDSQTEKVLLDRFKLPKPLPPFDRLLLYDRLPLNAPHKIARFHVYSRNPPPLPTIDDPRTWEPFLPADEEFDPEEVRAGWDDPLAEISKVKETVVDNGIRRPTRQTVAPKNKAEERVVLASHTRRSRGFSKRP